MNKHSFFSSLASFRNPEFKQIAFQRKCVTAIREHLKWLVTDFELTDDLYQEGRPILLEPSKTKVDDNLELVIATEIDLRGHILTYIAFHSYKEKQPKAKEGKVDDTSKVNQPTGFGFSRQSSDRDSRTPWPTSMDPKDTETHTVSIKRLSDRISTFSVPRSQVRHETVRGPELSLVDTLTQDHQLREALWKAEFRMFYSEEEAIFTVAII